MSQYFVVKVEKKKGPIQDWVMSKLWLDLKEKYIINAIFKY